MIIGTLGKRGIWGEGNVFAEWLAERSDNGAENLDDAVLTDERLSGFHILVVLDVTGIGRTYSSDEVAALRRFVENGGGLMTTIGYTTQPANEVVNYNTLLAPFGLGYAPTLILPKSGGQTIPIQDWSEHPITQGVTAVGVDYGYPVTGDGTVIARRNGHDVGAVTQFGEGRVFAWADEWITYDSEWVGRDDYQLETFWINVIQWLMPVNQCQVPNPIVI